MTGYEIMLETQRKLREIAAGTKQAETAPTEQTVTVSTVPVVTAEAVPVTAGSPATLTYDQLTEAATALVSLDIAGAASSEADYANALVGILGEEGAMKLILIFTRVKGIVEKAKATQAVAPQSDLVRQIDEFNQKNHSGGNRRQQRDNRRQQRQPDYVA